jgi:hypothetical protein
VDVIYTSYWFLTVLCVMALAKDKELGLSSKQHTQNRTYQNFKWLNVVKFYIIMFTNITKEYIHLGFYTKDIRLKAPRGYHPEGVRSNKMIPKMSKK